MAREDWLRRNEERAVREQERDRLERSFNDRIIQRVRAGQSKEFIVADLQITRELYNRVVRSAGLTAR